MGKIQSKEDSLKKFVDSLRNKFDYYKDNKNKDNYIFLDFSLNLVLVYYGARDAYLFESSNIKSDKDDTEKYLKCAEDLGFFILLDPQSMPDDPRYFITKFKIVNLPEDDESVGTLLGMKDPGEDYFDYRKTRTIIRFVEINTDVHIITEIVKTGDNKNIEYAQYKIEKFNKVMEDLNLSYKFRFDLEITDGTYKREQELKFKNINYAKKNKEEYINDLSNGLVSYPSDQHPLFILFDRCLYNKKMFNVYLPLFLEFYSLFNSFQNDIVENQRILNEKMIDIMEDSL